MKKRLYIGLTLAVMALLLLVACGGSATSANNAQTQGDAVASAGDAKKGEEMFDQVCIACHGAGGVGIENLGKPFTTSEFVRNNNNEDLLAFVKTGRPISNPDNTTGVDMPPKGGNPALTDAQILDIIAYIRTLQK